MDFYSFCKVAIPFLIGVAITDLGHFCYKEIKRIRAQKENAKNFRVFVDALKSYEDLMEAKEAEEAKEEIAVPQNNELKE